MENVLPASSFFTQLRLRYSAPASTCGRFFHFGLFRVQPLHLRLRGAPHSQRRRLSGVSVRLCLSSRSDGAVCLSLHSQLLLDFTYSPEPHCVHGHVVISSLTSIPNTIFFHFPTPQCPCETLQ